MTGPLALAGGAAFGSMSVHLDAMARTGAKVTVLPTAMAYENPAPLIDAVRKHLGSLSVDLEVVPAYTRADAMEPSSASAVEDAEVLYITGGSPMHLRSVLLGSPLLAAGVRNWESGATVIAEAEAASVLCSHMVDARGGAFTVGIGLITSLTVIPRFDHWSPDKRHRTVGLAPPELPVVGIDESAALIRDGEGNWSAAGQGDVHVLVAGAPASLSDLPAELV